MHLSKAAEIVKSEVVQSKLKNSLDTFPVTAEPNLFLSLMHMITGSSYTALTQVDVDNGLEY